MICDFQPVMSYEEVAKLMTAQGDPITPPGVRVIEKRALKKLRDALKKNGITSINDLIDLSGRASATDPVSRSKFGSND